MDRPFREVHELYRLVYLRAEAQAKEKEEREKKEAEEARKRKAGKPKGIQPPHYLKQQQPSDATVQPNINMELSPLEAEALEDALEDLM